MPVKAFCTEPRHWSLFTTNNGRQFSCWNRLLALPLIIIVLLLLKTNWNLQTCDALYQASFGSSILKITRVIDGPPALNREEEDRNTQQEEYNINADIEDEDDPVRVPFCLFQ